MAKIDCFEIPGLDCWFWSNDHDPPHFHAKRNGEWEIKVMFTQGNGEMFELVWGEAPPSKVLRELSRAVQQHRFALLLEWERKVSR